MQPIVFCLGAINVDLIYRVDDLAGFLQNWGTAWPGRRRGALPGGRGPAPGFAGALWPALWPLRRRSGGQHRLRPGPPGISPRAWWGGWGRTRMENSSGRAWPGSTWTTWSRPATAAEPISCWTRRGNAPSWGPPYQRRPPGSRPALGGLASRQVCPSYVLCGRRALRVATATGAALTRRRPAPHPGPGGALRAARPRRPGGFPG